MGGWGWSSLSQMGTLPSSGNTRSHFYPFRQVIHKVQKHLKNLVCPVMKNNFASHIIFQTNLAMKQPLYPLFPAPSNS